MSNAKKRLKYKYSYLICTIFRLLQLLVYAVMYGEVIDAAAIVTFSLLYQFGLFGSRFRREIEGTNVFVLMRNIKKHKALNQPISSNEFRTSSK